MSNIKFKVGIMGAAGYTGGELIRILLQHPAVEISFAHSKSQEGKKIDTIHQDLLGETDILFTGEINFQEIDILFLCLGHGESKIFLETNSIPKHLKIIDLSQDFRLRNIGNDFIYGLPELNKSDIKKAKYIANPGCFATAIQLAFLPLAQAGLIQSELHIQGITGSTGAGQSLSATSHFSWRDNNISVYKAFEHQHLAEIKQSLTQLQLDFHQQINFIPVRGNFSRGIFINAYFSTNISLEVARELFQNYYQNEPFVVLSSQNPNLKQVVNTNKAILYLEKHGDKLLIIACIDNLLKGASGQAVQNMNLLFDLPEDTGLRLKANVY